MSKSLDVYKVRDKVGMVIIVLVLAVVGGIAVYRHVDPSWRAVRRMDSDADDIRALFTSVQQRLFTPANENLSPAERERDLEKYRAALKEHADELLHFNGTPGILGKVVTLRRYDDKEAFHVSPGYMFDLHKHAPARDPSEVGTAIFFDYRTKVVWSYRTRRRTVYITAQECDVTFVDASARKSFAKLYFSSATVPQESNTDLNEQALMHFLDSLPSLDSK